MTTFIFRILFVIWFILCASICMPLMLLFPRKFSHVPGHIWSKGVSLLLRLVGRISYRMTGQENLPHPLHKRLTPPDKGYVIACKHQSEWDTIIFLSLTPKTCYILKKELLTIPLFGYYIKKMNMIAIDRKGGASAMKRMVSDVKKRVDQGYVVVIFPEGTRTSPGQKSKYHPGIAMIDQLNKSEDGTTIDIIPASLNSGEFWGKGQRIIKPGTIDLSFHPAMEKNLDRKAFMEKLEGKIEGRD